MNQTIAFYTQNQQPQAKFSNREYMNQSKNSRSINKKKGLAYMKQMMNKTVMVQNNDYHIFENPLPDSKCVPDQRIDRVKINKKQIYAIQNELIVSRASNVIEKQVQRRPPTARHQRVHQGNPSANVVAKEPQPQGHPELPARTAKPDRQLVHQLLHRRAAPEALQHARRAVEERVVAEQR